jgi:hypothetical protein
MVVSWIPLNYPEARGFISHYTVAYFILTSVGKRSQSDVMTKRVEGMDASTTTVEGLDPNTEFSVQVSATNGAGTSGLNKAMQVAVFQGTYVSRFLIKQGRTVDSEGQNFTFAELLTRKGSCMAPK